MTQISGIRSDKVAIAKRHLADCMEAPDYPLHACHATCDDLANLLTEIDTWRQIWDDQAFLEARVEALRDGTSVG